MAHHIGTSGWSYDHWQGIVYPATKDARKRLDFYVQRFETVEVNNTHYRWPTDETFAAWREHLPRGFLMSAKASRGLTQFHRLKNPEDWLKKMGSGLRRLGKHRGILLVQLPPWFAADHDRLASFLAAVPSWMKTAIEFRHPTWQVEETFALLEQHGVAYCVMSGANLPCILRATAPFVYVRLHGPSHQHLYAGSYSDDDLHWWADRIREWEAQDRDVWAYFNNDGEGHAVRNAETLIKFLSGV